MKIVKILCGGFPCTKFSVAQKSNREKLNFPIDMFMNWKEQQGAEWFKHIDDFEEKLSFQQGNDFKFGEGMQLFFNCVVAKEKMNPDYFIFENVSSMDKGIKEFIQAILKCDVTETNANMVSAQNRKRVIFHNLGIVQNAEDKGILLKDILESGIVDKEKAYHLNVDNIKPVPIQVSRKHGIKTGKDKSLASCASDWRGINRNQMQNAVIQPVCIAQRGRYLRDDGGVMQHFEPREDGKTNTLTTVSKDNLVANPVRIGTIDSNSQAHRVYSPYGKSVTLVSNGGGQGAKTGLYATPIKLGEIGNGGQGNRIYSTEGKSVSLTAQGGGIGSNTGLYAIPVINLDDYDNVILHDNGNIEVDGKLIYCVQDGKIPYKDKLYDINLPDGHYIIRKLTPLECERLQTLPSWKIETEVQIYLDQAKSFVSAVEKNPKLLKLVLNAENEELNEYVKTVVKDTQQNNRQTRFIVQKNVDTMIKIWQQNAIKHNKIDENSNVGNADKNMLPLLHEIGEISVPVNVPINSTVEKTTSSGKAVSLQKDNLCITVSSGKMLLNLSGNEIMQLVKDVENYLHTQKGNSSTYTILSRLRTSNIEQMLIILYYFVKAVTDLYTAEKIQNLNILFVHNVPYTKGVSDSQRYKMIGNGWCKDDIKRFFDAALTSIDRGEHIECQSFYDGIATARLILDDLGFRNITYTAYEVDKYAMKVATSNYPDIKEAGDAFVVREDDWLQL